MESKLDQGTKGLVSSQGSQHLFGNSPTSGDRGVADSRKFQLPPGTKIGSDVKNNFQKKRRVFGLQWGKKGIFMVFLSKCDTET